MTASTATFDLVPTGTDSAHRFRAFVPDEQGDPLAEHSFAWRTDSTALAQDLGDLAQAATSGRPPENDLHQTFGQNLFQTIFGGDVAALWAEKRQAAKTRRHPLRLVLRPDPQTARLLLNLPWEYLYDGDDFLALNWRTPLSRLPWDLPVDSLPRLAEPLRLLVLIAAPQGLSQNQVLNTAREEDLILGALAGARRAGHVEIEFTTPNGSLEALETALREFDPHALHFVGHGIFVEAEDSGLLLLEKPDGQKRQVPNADFANLLERRAQSLRFVFLSACQSAVAPRNDGYADLAPRLLAAGIPAVVAMQFSVLNHSAMDFGHAFYQGLAGGDSLDAALTEARGKLARTGLNTVDFATPILFLADPDCLQVNQAALQTPPSPTPLDLTGTATAQNFVGRSAELRTLQTNLDPQQGCWRSAIIYGLGGMGKTVLAERMAARLDGVKAIRMTPTITAQAVLDQLGGFLLVNQARLNHPRINDFMQVKDEALPLENKAAVLIEILRERRLLLIFDNYEDVLPEGQPVSRVGQAVSLSADPDLARLVSLLLNNIPGPSRFLFTSRIDFSRIDFSPLEAGRLSDAIGHLALSELQFRDAVYLLETLPPLDQLPVAILSPSPTNGGGVRGGALSIRALYDRLGGHPYTLNLFSEHARRSSAQEVLADLAGVQQELLDFTLLDRAAAALPERAATLLRRAAIYDEPVPGEGLAFMLGGEQDAMPPVEAEVQALLSWGLLARPPHAATSPADQPYAIHTFVRDWARQPLTADERLTLLRRAAQFWQGTGRESGDMAHFLNARHYLFLAGDFEQADEIVQAGGEYLLRWGQIELLLELLNESVRTLSGQRRAIALTNLSTVYKQLGHYDAARKIYEQVLAKFEAWGDWRNVAAILHQLGMLHQAQGEYTPARQRYEQSLKINQELDNRAGIALSLHQFGNLHYFQGEYEQARQHYEQSLKIEQALGNRDRIAELLHDLGILHQLQGEYTPARQRYGQSLKINQELGDQAGIAASLHHLGVLHQTQGEYEPARQRYEQSLKIEQELGDRHGIAQSLHNLGNLHYLQGEYEPARQRYEQSLKILQELGDRHGIAKLLHNLGVIHQDQGEYEPARQRYEQSLKIEQELGNQAGIAASLYQLGRLFEDEEAYEQAVPYVALAFVIFEQLGSPDREIAGRVLARLRDKLGGAAFEAAWPRRRAEAQGGKGAEGQGAGVK